MTSKQTTDRISTVPRSRQHIAELTDVTKVYQMGSTQVRALAGVNATFDAGSFWSIMGPSGSGKSTMLNLLGCLDHPTSGRYLLEGQNVALLLGVAVALLTLVMARRRAALLTLLGLLIPYVLLVGADPPVVRAAIMAVGIVIASVLGRRTPGWIYLVYATTSMVAWDPLYARDVAFQLSATATAGVIVLAPALTEATL